LAAPAAYSGYPSRLSIQRADRERPSATLHLPHYRTRAQSDKRQTGRREDSRAEMRAGDFSTSARHWRMDAAGNMCVLLRKHLPRVRTCGLLRASHKVTEHAGKPAVSFQEPSNNPFRDGSEAIPVAADPVITKWRNWLTKDLYAEFEKLVHDKVVFEAFLASLNPYVGQEEGAEIAEWIGLNYFASACVALRRLDDNDQNSVSLCRLLIDMKDHADVLTEANLIKHNAYMRPGTALDPATVTVDMRDVLTMELGLLDQFGGIIKRFVNKNVAHLDKQRHTIEVPNVQALEKAILCFHNIYRKYACCVGGIACQLDKLNPLDLIPPIDVDYKSQFGRIWSAASGA
jgi:hypothetical protein